jgi:formylglycine-generating enzyme required for sulfatase activity
MSHAVPIKKDKTILNPKDGTEVVWVPTGVFLMGTNEDQLAAWLIAHPGDKRDWFNDELPQRRVYLDGYWIYKTEVTVAQYRTFCQATGCAMPQAPPWDWQDDHPVVNVSWEDANAYAQWAGAALPTEAQWEKAARGTDGRLYPWGNAWPPPARAGNFADQACKRSGQYPNLIFIDGYDDGYVNTSPVGGFPAGVSPHGCLDMEGNVGEWCTDWCDYDYYRNAPSRNPIGPATGKYRAVRGGGWDDGYTPRSIRAAYRPRYTPTDRYHFIGFRCVLRSPGP